MACLSWRVQDDLIHVPGSLTDVAVKLRSIRPISASTQSQVLSVAGCETSYIVTRASRDEVGSSQSS